MQKVFITAKALWHGTVEGLKLAFDRLNKKV